MARTFLGMFGMFGYRLTVPSVSSQQSKQQQACTSGIPSRRLFVDRKQKWIVFLALGYFKATARSLLVIPDCIFECHCFAAIFSNSQMASLRFGLVSGSRTGSCGPVVSPRLGAVQTKVLAGNKSKCSIVQPFLLPASSQTTYMELLLWPGPQSLM